MRILAATLALLLLAPAAFAEDRTPFVGIGPLDPFAAGDTDPARLAHLEGAGTVLATTRPIAWERLEPVPARTGPPRYRWEALDRAVLVWQLAGLQPVLVLSPQTSWGGVARARSAWTQAVQAALPPAEAAAALRSATGATPPRGPHWAGWERLVRDVVERYDGDGIADMPGLRAPVRHLQVLGGIDPAWWLGDDEQLLRLLHHAMEGARAASSGCRILAPTIDLRASGHAPFPDEREWSFRLGRLTPGSAQPLARMEVQRHFGCARRLLGQPRLYDVLCHAGSTHVEDDVANLRFLRRTLDAAGATSTGLWLLDDPTRKLGPARNPNALEPKRDEQRLRRRWLPVARNPRHAQHGRARAWMRRGQAYDLVRGVCRACAAGADAVVCLAPFDALPAGHPLARVGGDQGMLTDDGAGGQRPTASWYALAQACTHLRGHRGAGETPIGAPGVSVIFQLEAPTPRPWASVLLLAPRLSWAGEPGVPLPLRDVLVTLPRGTYTLEWIRTGPEAPRRREVVSDGSITVQLGPEPVYVLPKP